MNACMFDETGQERPSIPSSRLEWDIGVVLALMMMGKCGCPECLRIVVESCGCPDCTKLAKETMQ